MTTTHLTCRQLVEIISDYLDDALDETSRNELERHLVACEGCKAYLEQLRLTTRLSRSLTEDDVPAVMLNTLLDAFRAG